MIVIERNREQNNNKKYMRTNTSLLLFSILIGLAVVIIVIFVFYLSLHMILLLLLLIFVWSCTLCMVHTVATRYCRVQINIHEVLILFHSLREPSLTIRRRLLLLLLLSATSQIFIIWIHSYIIFLRIPWFHRTREQTNKHLFPAHSLMWHNSYLHKMQIYTTTTTTTVEQIYFNKTTSMWWTRTLDVWILINIETNAVFGCWKRRFYMCKVILCIQIQVTHTTQHRYVFDVRCLLWTTFSVYITYWYRSFSVVSVDK